MLAILAAIVPVGFIILVGAWAGRRLTLEVHSLSQVTVYLLAPALIIDGFYGSTLSAAKMATILLGFALISLCLFAVVGIIATGLRLPPDTRKSLVVASLLPNNGNMGLSVASFAFGTMGLERALIYMIGSSILLFGITPAYLDGKGFWSGMRLIFHLPLFWSILIGVGLQTFSLSLPLQLDKGIESLGQASIPLSLIILGIQLSSTPFAFGRFELLGAFFRLIVAPIIAYFVGIGLGLSGLDFKIFVLQSAMPTAVNTVVLATQFGGDAPLMARLVVVTTLGSFFTLPLVLWGLTH